MWNLQRYDHDSVGFPQPHGLQQSSGEGWRASAEYLDGKDINDLGFMVNLYNRLQWLASLGHIKMGGTSVNEFIAQEEAASGSINSWFRGPALGSADNGSDLMAVSKRTEHGGWRIIFGNIGGQVGEVARFPLTDPNPTSDNRGFSAKDWAITAVIGVGVISVIACMGLAFSEAVDSVFSNWVAKPASNANDNLPASVPAEPLTAERSVREQITKCDSPKNSEKNVIEVISRLTRETPAGWTIVRVVPFPADAVCLTLEK